MEFTNKRKYNDDYIENHINILQKRRIIAVKSKFTTFKNVFQTENIKPFYEINRTLPIFRNVNENNNNPFIKKYMNIYCQHYIQYMPSNNILYEKYMMDNEIVFEIYNGNEELIIPCIRKSKDKIRNVYVNNIKRISIKYNKKGEESNIMCFYENGKLEFTRMYKDNHYLSYKYDKNGIIIKKWIE